jgi:hypothetical protein
VCGFVGKIVDAGESMEVSQGIMKSDAHGSLYEGASYISVIRLVVVMNLATIRDGAVARDSFLEKTWSASRWHRIAKSALIGPIFRVSYILE